MLWLNVYAYIYICTHMQICAYVCWPASACRSLCVYVRDFNIVIAAFVLGFCRLLLDTVRLLSGDTLLKFRALWTFACVVVVFYSLLYCFAIVYQDFVGLH